MPKPAGHGRPSPGSTTHRSPEGRPRRRGVAGAAVLLVTAGTLAACGSDDGGASTLTWYINPDAGGQAEMASRCTEEAGGAYTIETAQLPRGSAAQREQLTRRRPGEDSSIDIRSLAPPYIPEFAQAGFLAPVPEDVGERVTEDVVQSAIDGSTWNDELVAVPFWANTQLFWYKKSVAEAAGLDPENEPVTWEQLVAAAEDQGTTIAAQGIRAEALTVWLNALVESAGGSIIEETAADPADIQLGLESDAAVAAAEVMNAVGAVGGPGLLTAGGDAKGTHLQEGGA